MTGVLLHEQPPVISGLLFQFISSENIDGSVIERCNAMQSVTLAATDKLFPIHTFAARSAQEPQRPLERGIS